MIMEITQRTTAEIPVAEPEVVAQPPAYDPWDLDRDALENEYPYRSECYPDEGERPSDERAHAGSSLKRNPNSPTCTSSPQPKTVHDGAS